MMRNDRRKDGSQQGAALIGAVLVMLILSMLGTVSLNLAALEIESVGAARDEAVARHLAEAGADLVVQWFHDPQTAPAGTDGSLLGKRYELPHSGPSFFDAQGVSQFVGTADHPDLVYEASKLSDDRLLNDPVSGWFRSLSPLGRILKLKVYGPTRPGLLCTVEVTAGAGGGSVAGMGGSGGLTRTLSVQLGARTIPPLRAGVQVGTSGAPQSANGPLPIWLHWGDMKVMGDARFAGRDQVPTKTALAPVTGQSYADTTHREDRWLDIWIGGAAFFGRAASELSGSIPANVYPRQDPIPGLKEDRWDYATMKKQALLYGSYYALERDGLLYRNGTVEPGLGRTADEVFGSEAVGDHHGLVFVDTLDRRPPGADNLGSLSLETEYAEGLFVVNAHLRLEPRGTGKSVPVLSPPGEGLSSLASRVPVELSGIHVQGVLYTPGDLTIEGRPRMYGALVVGGKVTQASEVSGQLEIWYTYELRSGLVQGIPLVYVAPGTWVEKY
ncbi:MAG: pilus assembly PilX family protein [Nitrospiraceae bacterium]